MDSFYDFSDMEYAPIYRKIGIYNRNARLLHENCSRIADISYNFNEQMQIRNILFQLREQIISEYVNESLTDKLSSAKTALADIVKNAIDRIPENVKNAYLIISKLIERGIKTVKEFLRAIGKV